MTSPSDPIEVLRQLSESFDGGDWECAQEIWTHAVASGDLEIEDILFIWQYLGSKERAFLKGDDRKYLHTESIYDRL